MINKVFIGFLIGCGMSMTVVAVVTLTDAVWLSSLIIAVLGGLSGFLIGEFGDDKRE